MFIALFDIVFFVKYNSSSTFVSYDSSSSSFVSYDSRHDKLRNNMDTTESTNKHIQEKLVSELLSGIMRALRILSYKILLFIYSVRT